jgi:hypothetical protein
MEKSTHQTATLANDAFVAAAASANPNHSGWRIHARFRSSRVPPPRYPRAYPAADTRSVSSGRATVGSSES